MARSEQEMRRAMDPLIPHPPIRRFYSTESERGNFVRGLFEDGAKDYEWVNRVMSLGSGQKYRRDALRRAGLSPGMTVLDVCMGSGQTARAALDLVGAEGRVIGLDASERMLDEARRHVAIPMTRGLAESLPIAEGSADFLVMGYALRHVADLRQTFAEFRRVLRPGGRLLLIEFARPASRSAYLVVRFYLGSVVPRIARLKGPRAAEMMRYFWDTIENCVPPQQILDALRDEGFADPVKGGQLDLFAEYTAAKPA